MPANSADYINSILHHFNCFNLNWTPADERTMFQTDWQPSSGWDALPVIYIVDWSGAVLVLNTLSGRQSCPISVSSLSTSARIPNDDRPNFHCRSLEQLTLSADIVVSHLRERAASSEPRLLFAGESRSELSGCRRRSFASAWDRILWTHCGRLQKFG